MNAKDWWGIAANIAQVAAAVFAAVATGFAWSGVRRMKQQGGIDVLFRLETVWNSPEMQTKKKLAAQSLLCKWLARNDARTRAHARPDVNQVLDFFETVARFINRGIINPYWARHTLCWRMINYYAAARGKFDDSNPPTGPFIGPSPPIDYIARVQAETGVKQWQDLQNAIPTLLRLDAGGHHWWPCPWHVELPSREAVAEFLRNEMGIE